MQRFKHFFETSVVQTKLKQEIDQVTSILRKIVNPTGMKMMSAYPKIHNESMKFWSDPQFLSWLESYGARANKIPPDFKDGGGGRAYFIDPYVVKFTSDIVEFHVAGLVAGRTDLPSPIIAVKNIGGNCFAILEHKINVGKEIDKNIIQAADWMTEIIDKNPNLPGFPKDPKEQEYLISRSGAPSNLFPYMKMVMTALAALYHATGYKYDDIGPTNVGLHQGKVSFHDLGPNQTKDFEPNKALDQIAKNRKVLGLD